MKCPIKGYILRNGKCKSERGILNKQTPLPLYDQRWSSDTIKTRC